MLPKRNSKRHRALIAVLIRAREEARKSQRDVSVDVGMSINFAHLVESGERMLSAIELPDYAAALDLTAGELIERMLAAEKSEAPVPPKVDGRRKRSQQKR